MTREKLTRKNKTMFEDMGDSDSYFRAFFEQKIKYKAVQTFLNFFPIKKLDPECL